MKVENHFATRTILARFAQQVEEGGDRIALKCGTLAITYRELDRSSTQLAQGLRNFGVRKGDFVPLIIDRSIELVSMMLAVIKVGAAYVPIERGYPVERLQKMLALLQPSLVVYQGNAGTLPGLHMRSVSDLRSVSGAELIPDSNLNAESPLYVMFTSGSTGIPKAVVIPHRGVVRLVCESSYVQPSADEVVLHMAPTSFDAATFEVWYPLLNGGTCVVVPEGVTSGLSLQRNILAYRVTTIWLTSTLFSLFVDEDPQIFVGLRTLIVGGETLSVPHVRRVVSALPNTVIVNGYGPTECTTFSCTYPVPQTLPDSVVSIPIGTAIAATTTFIVDELLKEVPVHVSGELLIGGDGLALGYLGDTQRTQESFIEWTSAAGEKHRVYRTGDRVRRLADGVIDFIGRVDRQVKISGHRIELDEIEAELGKQSGVLQASVVTRVPGSEASPVLVGYFVGTATEQILRDTLTRTLPHYMVPQVLTKLKVMPLTAAGKIDRRALPYDETIDESRIAPPGTGASVEEVWRFVLRRKEIRPSETFLEAGGSSLKAVQLVSLLHRSHGVLIPVVKVFQYPSLASFSHYVEQLGGASGAVHHERAVDVGGGEVTDHQESIAVVGMACRFPGADTVAQFWDNLLHGRESISFFSDEELDASCSAIDRKSPSYVRARGILENVDMFDALFFDVPPTEAAILDPQQRLFLELCYEALEHACVVPEKIADSVGVFGGMWNNSYFDRNVAKDPETLKRVGDLQAMLGNEKDYLTTRVSHRLNLKGPSVAIQTACSTSLVAVVQGMRALQRGECKVALAGGVAISFPQKTGHLFQEGSILSADGHCRPFDAEASGTVFSDGAGVVVLKRTSDALRDGNVIYAVVKGAAVNNDGADRSSFTAPSVSGQEAVIRAAQKEARILPRHVGFIEAHGTATPLGDPIEIEALKNVFGADSTNESRCVVGSVKGNVGHLTIAAGIAGFIKSVLAVFHGVVPGTVHFNKLNPRIDLAEAPFSFSSNPVAWPGTRDERIAGVSAFGFGGSNVHLVLAEFSQQRGVAKSNSIVPNGTTLLFPISARSLPALQQVAKQLLRFLEENPNVSLFDLSYTLLQGRRIHEFTRVLEADSSASLAAQLTLVAEGQTEDELNATQHLSFMVSEGATGNKGQFLALPTYPFQRRRYWVGITASGAVKQESEHDGVAAAPNASVLPSVVKLFEDASGFNLSRSDVRTPFVELGIDSLILTQVAIDLRAMFGVEITFSQLLSRYTTFEELSEFIAEYARAQLQPIPSSVPSIGSITTVVYDGVLAPAEKGVGLRRAADQSASIPSELPSSGVVKPFGPATRISTVRSAPLSELQRVNLETFIGAYTKKTAGSKQATVTARKVLADPRVVSGFRPLMKELTYPIVVPRSEGSTLWDVDGNTYIDFTCGFGSNFFGHRFPIAVQAVKDQLDQGFEVGPQHPLAAEVALLVAEMVKQERVAFCNTGSEAVLGAVRMARTVTGRKRVAIFTGGYHGIFDEVVVREGREGVALPAAPGIMREAVENTLVLPWADPQSLEILRSIQSELAAVLVEPVQSRSPNVQPREFLSALRELTAANGVALIFDEIVTGFRIHPGGAQAYFGIDADICTYGKVVGGGMPIGIIAGKRRFMDALDGGDWRYGDESIPEVGVTYFAGTFVRFPLALAATKAVLLFLKTQGQALYDRLNERSLRMADEINTFLTRAEAPLRLDHFCSMMKPHFSSNQPFADLFYVWMRSKGIHIWDGRPCFLSIAHTDEDVQGIVAAFKSTVLEMQQAGFFPASSKLAMSAVPPVKGAKIGRDSDGNPAWFLADANRPGKFLRVGEVQ